MTTSIISVKQKGKLSKRGKKYREIDYSSQNLKKKKSNLSLY